MYYTVFLVLDNLEHESAILDGWEKTGITGITILDSTGLGRIRQRATLRDDMPLLPSLHAPTVSHLYDHDWLALETVVDSDRVRDLIPQLSAAGAQGILEYELKKIV